MLLPWENLGRTTFRGPDRLPLCPKTLGVSKDLRSLGLIPPPLEETGTVADETELHLYGLTLPRGAVGT